MSIVNQERWDEWQNNNKDGYGGACIKVAKRVMEILDEDSTPLVPGYYPDPHTPHGIICIADDDTKAGGITGFMASAVAQMVFSCHSRGKEFNEIRNTQSQICDEGDKATKNGVALNTAVINIG